MNIAKQRNCAKQSCTNAVQQNFAQTAVFSHKKYTQRKQIFAFRSAKIAQKYCERKPYKRMNKFILMNLFLGRNPDFSALKLDLGLTNDNNCIQVSVSGLARDSRGVKQSLCEPELYLQGKHFTNFINLIVFGKWWKIVINHLIRSELAWKIRPVSY